MNDEPSKADSSFRDLFPVTRNVVYFNHAAVGPLSVRACEAMERHARDQREFGALHWREWYAEYDRLRASAARLIGADAREIAILTLRRQFTVDVSIQEDHELIDRGVYAVIRHPAYTGAIISFAGLGLVFDNWLSFAAVLIIAVAALSYRIAVEERALVEHFGDRYRAYARRTKRLIPGIY